MNLRQAPSIIAFALAAGVAGPAFAQADNSNSVTEPERVLVALASPETTRWTIARWWRDDARRREPTARHAEGLTAAELGILYGASFASGSDEAPAGPAPQH
jgi:hypothetical protein